MSKSFKDIASKAIKLIKNSNIINPPVPIKKIVKKLGLAIIPYDFGENISGALFVENDKAYIGINQNESLVRCRFTLAHELGHFVLHNEEKNSIFVDNKNIQILFRHSENPKDIIEKEANVFAANLLMPDFMIKNSLRLILKENITLTDDEIVKLLAKEYKVSQVAMSYRLLNLGYINL